MAIDSFDSGATLKCTFTDSLNALRKADGCQSAAIDKCIRVNACYACGDFQLFYFIAVQEQMFGIIQRVGLSTTITIRILLECYSTPCRQIGDVYCRKSRAIIESIISDTFKDVNT